MRKRITAGLVVVAAGLAAVADRPGPVAAQPKTDKGSAPKYLYGHDLKVRPGGERDWTKAVAIGVEWFQHEAADGEGAARKVYPFTIAISEAGTIGVLPAGPVGADKTTKWLTGNDIKVRKAGESEFTQKTKAWGVEMFRDNGSDRLLYVSEAASIAFAPIPASLTTNKGPKWHHALELKVRPLTEKTFTNANKFGLEVSTDENTGGLLYVTETGSIATAPAAGGAPDAKQLAGWKPAYGYVLKARTADETEFTDKTRRIAVEVLVDETTGNFLYVTETGSLAVTPKSPSPTDVSGDAALTWLGALNLPVRKAGDKGFDKAKKYKVEMFRDNRSGNLMFISETGAIAVLTR